jgi:hypothetical protein
MPAEKKKNLEQRVRALERETRKERAATPAVSQRGGRSRRQSGERGVRRRSRTRLWGFPLWEIASGPDPEHGERRGHARALFAVGDVADGIFAMGGIARGVVSVGGLSFGVVSLGGVAISLLAAAGGVAIAPVARGGVAVGLDAVGGAAVGLHPRPSPGTRGLIRHPSRRLRRAQRRLRRWLRLP